MNRQFSHVLSPIRVNGVFYKNRLIVAPITPHSSDCDNSILTKMLSLTSNRAPRPAPLSYTAAGLRLQTFSTTTSTATGTPSHLTIRTK